MVVFLHGGLVLDLVHLMELGAGGDVELGTQPCVTHQPVLVVGFQPVDLAIFIGEERNSLENLIIILQLADNSLIHQIPNSSA